MLLLNYDVELAFHGTESPIKRHAFHGKLADASMKFWSTMIRQILGH
jgi:hypothetical protein